MEPKSLLNHNIPPDLNGRYNCGYGGANIPEHITSQRLHSKTGRQKSKVRLNDQLIPKPTDINIAEKMIKTASPKEHPYASHISRFAMFPSFRSPDNPEMYIWPLKGENQVLSHSPPTTAPTNPKLNDWDFSVKRSSNMLEKTQWVTSYQIHYTGPGLANPFKIEDFKEKFCDQTGLNSHTAPLIERSYPVFVPSEPKQGYRGRQGSCVGRSTCSPSAAQHKNSSSHPKQGTATATISQRGPQEITAKHNEADLNPKGYRQSKYSAGSTEAQGTELSQEVSCKQQTEGKSLVHEHGRRKSSRQVQFGESLMQVSMSQSSQEANSAWITDTEQPQDLNNHPLSQGEKSLIELCDEPRCKRQYYRVNSSSHSQSALAKNLADIDSHPVLLSRAASQQEKPPEVRELSHGISNPCILLRPPVLPGIHPVATVGSTGRENAAVSLLDLQNSFSKSKAHRNFNSSVSHAAVDLRDNVVTGKKHNFYGINCYYLHG